MIAEVERDVVLTAGGLLLLLAASAFCWPILVALPIAILAGWEWR